MPLQQTSGNVTADAYGGGVAAVPNYIESVFQTYLYTGNGSTQTINNGIDLAGKGGLVMFKSRTEGSTKYFGYTGFVDTVRGTGSMLTSFNANAEVLSSTFVNAFNSNGFGVGSASNSNYNGDQFASWTFRKQPKFFDVVTYTGNGNNAGQVINHNLGSTPGFIICKCTSATQDWAVCARTGGNASPESDITYATGLSLNTTAAAGYSGALGSFPTSTTFNTSGLFTSPGAYPNLNGQTYVAYLFAHNAGGFGLTGTDNVISCGSFTRSGSSLINVNLGYEAQWVLFKNISASDDWYLFDNMRGMPLAGTAKYLSPNLANAESSLSAPVAYPTATGFTVDPASGVAGSSGNTSIYIAIRRGPMKVPTDASKVFAPLTYNGNSTQGTLRTAGFTSDVVLSSSRTSYPGTVSYDRLRGAANRLATGTTGAEVAESGSGIGLFGFDSNVGYIAGTDANRSAINWSGAYVNWSFRRAPGFFDEVCYTGTGAYSQAITHNLGVVPELIIVKCRNTGGPAGYGWISYCAQLNGGVNAQRYYIYLNRTDAAGGPDTIAWGNTVPTTTQFSVGAYTDNGDSGKTYVAYLFATCAGVSKCTAFTGTGTLQTINCGFTSGARFVLIKRTDAAGDWYVWDSSRGISSSTDPYLLLNSAAAEVTSTNWVDTTSTGFQVTAASGNNVNINGASYIALAIA